MDEYELARIIHETRISLCWGKHAIGKRQPWPDFADPAVKRSYPHNPIAYVDIALSQAGAVMAAFRGNTPNDGADKTVGAP